VDAGSLSPPDAIVALRSFPRRFRALMPPSDGTDDEHDRARRAAAERAAATATTAIVAATGDLRRVLLEDHPQLGAATPAPGGDLDAAATALAKLAGAQPADAWARTGQRGAATVSAADLLREAVGAAAAQLRGAGVEGDDSD